MLETAAEETFLTDASTDAVVGADFSLVDELTPWRRHGDVAPLLNGWLAR
jgi:hypothetical protein